METLREIVIKNQNDEYYVRIRKELKVVLEFVERYNKQDAEKNVANAAQFLEMIL